MCYALPICNKIFRILIVKSKINMNRHRKALIIFIIVIFSYPAAWMIVKHSDAYAVAESFISQSLVIRNNLGTIKDISLKPFGNSMRFAGEHGSAHFELIIKGIHQGGTVYIELVKRGMGIWEVSFARLMLNNEQTIQLK